MEEVVIIFKIICEYRKEAPIFFFKRFESLSLGNIISSPKWRVIKDQMKKPGPELGKDISKVTSSRLCEQLDAACEEKDSEENDSCVSASFFYRE